MGPHVSSWTFMEMAPSFEVLAAALESRLEVAVMLEDFQTVAERSHGAVRLSAEDLELSFARLRVPTVRADCFALSRRRHRLDAEAPLPAHPYLAYHLDAAVRLLGGRRLVSYASALPPARSALLERPWKALGAWTRFRLHGPSWLGWETAVR